MTQPLRVWHRRTVFGLALALPILFTAAITVRKSASPESAPLKNPGEAPPLEWGASVPFQLNGHPAKVRESVDGAWIEIDPVDDPLAPDLLIYWSDSPPSPDGLPENSHLLGAAAGRGAHKLALPASVRCASGYLTFYSLARQELAGGVRLEGQP
jgi:hypothetical protein